MALNAMHAKNMSKTNVYDAFPVHMIHLTIHVYNKKKRCLLVKVQASEHEILLVWNKAFKRSLHKTMT